jgi:hypothetical protein
LSNSFAFSFSRCVISLQFSRHNQQFSASEKLQYLLPFESVPTGNVR